MTEHIEQPMPTRNGHVSIQSLVRIDLEAREQVGIQRYGTALQPHNGRDALRDAYEEALDLACYLRQAMAERDTPRPLSLVEIEPFPQAGQRAHGTDLDGRAVVGQLTSFFAWSHETGRNERARLTLDSGVQAVVHTGSLRRAEVPRV